VREKSNIRDQSGLPVGNCRWAIAVRASSGLRHFATESCEEAERGPRFCTAATTIRQTSIEAGFSSATGGMHD